MQHKRLDRAYEMLTNPNCAERTVGEVASATGFVNATHFGRAFHARFGVAPSSVRRMYA
ncbi:MULTISPECIES: helix-turn-helix domain-containing protein [unclassified Microbacterium]|uniref:helix-turn-helix domain-containing protein n=1 Tax=unclassified Microbacterium TaxID=2609290 RepID=UPI0015FFD0DD|nr:MULTISPECIES: helix-turn-helix domain-containing protein [unclassified Microbacterium]MBT2486535.1 helix-turn-helix domain-containing protein [Microbacterium sp. ISL-108]